MDQKIGIWGLGIVGKSAVRYFSQKNDRIEVFDARALTQEEREFLTAHNAHYSTESLANFLENNDYILASCTIDLRPYSHYSHKWLSELDIFYQECKVPIIAITGSVGKTTITHLLFQLLIAHNKKVFMGGNIGVGLLDQIDHANQSDYVVLEVSSFQLERSSSFCPTLAIVTNIHANHLDRHGTFEQYQKAKLKIISTKNNQQVLIPFSLLHALPPANETKHYYLFSLKKPSDNELSLLDDLHTLYFLHNGMLMMYYQTNLVELTDITESLTITYPENILVLASMFSMLGLCHDHFAASLSIQHIPEHRLEKFATVRNIHFYNDSKSTIPASTLAAIENIHRPIVLFLGGVSKGVDRSELICQLKDKVKFIYCFGKEADSLKQWCEDHTIASIACATLEETVTTFNTVIKPGDNVLFSPAGASYDLFKDYKERGDCFKKLVHDFISKT